MPRLTRAGLPGSITETTATQATVRQQLAVLTDLMKQIAGAAAVSSGSAESADPLSAPFTLYVNPYTGSDKFVGGSYNDREATGTDEQIIAQKLKRIELQRLECGYTPYRPFRTINRAVIEAAIITSKNWYTYTDPRAHVDCVTIVLAPGVHTLYNDPGSASTSLASWGEERDPSTADLIQFNPATEGGVLLPRGCSLCGPDLRKTTIRPSWVPATVDETANYSNRRGMLKFTGSGYFFGYTFMDAIGVARSHHLLDCFHFASEAELDAFYAKCFSAVGSGADLGVSLTAARGTEYQIVGPIEQGQNPTSAWDTTASASPYVFNCSIRSDYGIGGIWADGGKVEGLRSVVTAQFTGVSLQKDMSCWQIFNGTTWVQPTYEQYIATSPDNVRMNPARLSRHISAINNAFIQEVSVFTIGQGVGHFTDLGGEITITNSNSSFGGCAAISRGYKQTAFPQDRNWSVFAIKAPLDVASLTGNVRKITLGRGGSISGNTITLQEGMTPGAITPTQPEALDKDGYTLRASTYLWVENPSGADWRALLAVTPWDPLTPAVINLTGPLTNADGDTLTSEQADGKRVYVRRLIDARRPEDRRVSLVLTNTASTRIPESGFVIQTDPARANGAISATLSASTQVICVTNTGSSKVATGAVRDAEVTLRRGGLIRTYANNTYYVKGTVVRFSGKLWQVNRDLTSPASGGPTEPDWGQTYVHMPSTFAPEDNRANEALALIFDSDTSNSEESTTLGYDFGTVYTSDTLVRDRYRASTDYLGAHFFLTSLGFTSDAAHAALLPRAEADRLRDPSDAGDFPTPPAGGAASGLGNWAVEFRRPSVLRLYGHAWEWAGWLNYSKSIPGAQQQLSPFNKFTYYFTNQLGGRVVPQGSNEDGFNISPRGLENIETGQLIDIDSIDSPDIDLPSLDRDIAIENLTVTGLLDLTGVTQLSADPQLFPYLPIAGSPTADVILRSLSVGTTAFPGYELTLQGAAAANFVTLAGSVIDCRISNYFKATVSGNVTYSFTNPPATGRYEMLLEIVYNSGAITLPGSARYLFGLLPVLVAGNTYQFICNTSNGGARWNVVVLEFPTA